MASTLRWALVFWSGDAGGPRYYRGGRLRGRPSARDRGGPDRFVSHGVWRSGVAACGSPDSVHRAWARCGAGCFGVVNQDKTEGGAFPIAGCLRPAAEW